MTQEPEHRSSLKPFVWLGGLFLLLVGASLVLASHFVRPIRTPSGHWLLARLSTPWRDSGDDARKGAMVRAYAYGVDGIARVEFDWDADGTYDCREDDCSHRTPGRRSACVSYRQGWRWIPAPPDMLQCTPGAPH